MGEIAEMIIDDILCEICGVYIGDACGYPRFCVDCDKNIISRKTCPDVKQHKKDKLFLLDKVAKEKK